ncbi:unnamed protein product [Protopolystoma xenopodis]|uniref:Dynein heavy chain C-terminal domain-containing protein n=1 Tax=Protopolystoma xenopodis TaxID=117903 RepID=A0A3S5FFS1_9PLAT|nr:unnamed protein product [Protopolystoma xenopodis]
MSFYSKLFRRALTAFSYEASEYIDCSFQSKESITEPQIEMIRQIQGIDSEDLSLEPVKETTKKRRARNNEDNDISGHADDDEEEDTEDGADISSNTDCESPNRDDHLESSDDADVEKEIDKGGTKKRKPKSKRTKGEKDEVEVIQKINDKNEDADKLGLDEKAGSRKSVQGRRHSKRQRQQESNQDLNQPPRSRKHQEDASKSQADGADTGETDDMDDRDGYDSEEPEEAGTENLRSVAASDSSLVITRRGNTTGGITTTGSDSERPGHVETRESLVGRLADGILARLPILFDVESLRKRHMGTDISPTTVVLLQELEKFNLILRKIYVSLNELKSALSGEAGMSAELDEICRCISNSTLPTSWRTLVPQTEKSLADWLLHLLRRSEQYKKWVN